MADSTLNAGDRIFKEWFKDVNRASYSVATVAALRALTVPDGAITVFVRGYASALDGGEGVFVYDSSSSATDNVGTIVAPDSGSGRWKRLTFGLAHNAKWFGATGDGSTDDTVALQRWLDSSDYCYAPAGTYKVTDDLTLADGHTVFGAGRELTIFSKTNYSGACFLGVDTDLVTLRDFRITGPGAATGSGNKGIDIHVSGEELCENIVVENILVTDMNDAGIYMGTCSFVSDSRVSGLMVETDTVLMPVLLKMMLSGITLRATQLTRQLSQLRRVTPNNLAAVSD
jgi:hypothetical protein